MTNPLEQWLKDQEIFNKEFDKRMEESNKKWAEENPEQAACNHGIMFDEDLSKGLSVQEVRQNWPRLCGLCPKGCGYNGIYYASYSHYVMGDW